MTRNYYQTVVYSANLENLNILKPVVSFQVAIHC